MTLCLQIPSELEEDYEDVGYIQIAYMEVIRSLSMTNGKTFTRYFGCTFWFSVLAINIQRVFSCCNFMMQNKFQLFCRRLDLFVTSGELRSMCTHGEMALTWSMNVFHMLCPIYNQTNKVDHILGCMTIILYSYPLCMTCIGFFD